MFVANNGAEFKLRKVSRLAVVEAAKAIPAPKVPRVYIEDKDRYDENPNDPDYVEALNECNYMRGMAVTAVYLALGAQVVKLPDDVIPYEDASWAEQLAELGILVPTTPLQRKVAWLKYIALNDDDDMTALLKAIARSSGVTLEEDVKTAEEAFRSQPGGNPPVRLVIAEQAQA